MKVQENILWKQKIPLVVIIIVAFTLAGIKLYLDEYAVPQNPDCIIDYGNGECVDGYFRIPFHNQNKQDVSRIKITVPFGIKTNITLPADFNVNVPLNPGKTGVLTLFPCDESVSIGSFEVEWCCGGDCQKSQMMFPSPQIKVVK
jgi:hypothetical protein